MILFRPFFWAFFKHGDLRFTGSNTNIHTRSLPDLIIVKHGTHIR